MTAEHSGLSKPKIAEAPKSARREKREKGRDRGTGQMRCNGCVLRNMASLTSSSSILETI